MRVLILGGNGFFGASVVRALAAFPGATAIVGSRRASGENSVRVDMTRPETFGVFGDFDAIVNAADTAKVPVVPAMDAALRAGKIFIETTAEAPVIRDLLTRRNSFGDAPRTGVAVLGMGIFPGLSTILAGDLVREGRATKRLVVGIYLDPASGAGGGMQHLMWQMMHTPAVFFENHERRECLPFAPGPVMPTRHGKRKLMRVDLPDADLLHASRNVPEIIVGLTAGPRLAAPVFRLKGFFVTRSKFMRALASLPTLWGLALARGWALRWRKATLEMAAIGDTDTDVVSRKYADGIGIGGEAIAASIAALLANRPAAGIYTPDEVFTMADIESRIPSLNRTNANLTPDVRAAGPQK